jgi:hypothetical protein
MGEMQQQLILFKWERCNNNWNNNKFTSTQSDYGLSPYIPITYITGTPTSAITFGTGTIPSTFTI